MNFLKYLSERLYWIVIVLFIVITSDIFLLTLNGSALLTVFISISVPMLFILGIYIDFKRRRRFLSDCMEALSNLDKKYLLPEVFDGYDTEEEMLLGLILKEMSRAMADRVSDSSRRQNDYKEYIETWVHEVKIPIATAGMILTNHGDELLKDSEIDTEISRISEYVEQALFYARSEAVEKDFFIKPIDLKETASHAIMHHRKALRSINASIDMHDLELDFEVSSDSKWIEFILNQIIANSIKYRTDPLKLEIFATVENKHASLHVKDNGIGIKESELSRIFDKGFTGTNGRTGAASTGMGLYLSKKLCSRLEHSLDVFSSPGNGTEIVITF